MAREAERQATVGTVRVPVTDVASLVREYLRLGLRLRHHDRGGAALELPCGMVLVLCRVRPLRRPAAA